MLGLPAIILPVDLTSAGLPLGVKLVGLAGADQNLISIAMSLEDCAGFSGHRPTVATSA